MRHKQQLGPGYANLFKDGVKVLLRLWGEMYYSQAVHKQMGRVASERKRDNGLQELGRTHKPETRIPFLFFITVERRKGVVRRKKDRRKRGLQDR